MRSFLIAFLEGFLVWAGSELLLSALLFLIYFAVIRRMEDPLDRFSSLCVSFGAVLILPWVPMPAVSEPIFRSLVTGVAGSLHGTWGLIDTNWGSWASQSAEWCALGLLPAAYLSVLGLRGRLIHRSLQSLRATSARGVRDFSLSSLPVMIHGEALPPLTIGVTDPRILISRQTLESLTPLELKLLVEHEEEHVRRGDGFANLFRIFLRELLFFSPFVWVLARKLEEEMEICVDRAVLFRNQHLSRGEISLERVYGSLLVKVADLSGYAAMSDQGATATVTVGTHFTDAGDSGLKRRLLCMKKKSKHWNERPVRSRIKSRALNGLALGLFLVSGTLGVSLFGNQAYSSSNRLEFLSDAPATRVVLTESDFSSASLSKCSQSCVLSLRLKPAAQKAFSQYTRENLGKKLSIVAGGRVISSPVIKAEITGQALEVTGGLPEAEARQIISRIGMR